MLPLRFWPAAVLTWSIRRVRAPRARSSGEANGLPHWIHCCHTAGWVPVRCSKSATSSPDATPAKTVPAGGRYGSAPAGPGRGGGAAGKGGGAGGGGGG